MEAQKTNMKRSRRGIKGLIKGIQEERKKGRRERKIKKERKEGVYKI